MDDTIDIDTAIEEELAELRADYQARLIKIEREADERWRARIDHACTVTTYTAIGMGILMAVLFSSGPMGAGFGIAAGLMATTFMIGGAGMVGGQMPR